MAVEFDPKEEMEPYPVMTHRRESPDDLSMMLPYDSGEFRARLLSLKALR